jgi:hypothetical protein
VSPIRLLLPFAGLLVLTPPAWADDQAICASHAGTLLTGTVASAPQFKHGMHRRGVELSHTHVQLRGDDGKRYDIAIDNVFASGYDQARQRVPAPLSQIQVGDRLQLCGQPYADGEAGMHWVHTNCGDQPTPNEPDGWLKVVGADGTLGPNLESSQEYCRLWP